MNTFIRHKKGRNVVKRQKETDIKTDKSTKTYHYTTMHSNRCLFVDYSPQVQGPRVLYDLRIESYAIRGYMEPNPNPIPNPNSNP